MPVVQRAMPVQVAVRLAPIPTALVLMVVMRIVLMLMRMRGGLVHVLMLVALGEVQPDAERHQRRGGPERRAGVCAGKQNGERRAEKRRDGKIRARACRAPIPG